VALNRELRAAVGCLTALGPGTDGPAVLAGGLALYPVVGLALGTAAAAAAAAVGTLAPAAAGPAGVLVLTALGGSRGPLGLAATAEALLRPGTPAAVLARLRARPAAPGIAVATAALATRAAAAAALPAPARTTALLLAPMLGAWAVVVQCYGGAPFHARGAAAALVGRARFREFAWASVVALGVTLSIGEPIGLVLVLVASLTTVALRLYAHRRLGGLTGRLLAATRESVETAVLVTMAVLAALAR
jgi:adenosylcobinamide-GDP ribazoletransferase